MDLHISPVGTSNPPNNDNFSVLSTPPLPRLLSSPAANTPHLVSQHPIYYTQPGLNELPTNLPIRAYNSHPQTLQRSTPAMMNDSLLVAPNGTSYFVSGSHTQPIQSLSQNISFPSHTAPSQNQQYFNDQILPFSSTQAPNTDGYALNTHINNPTFSTVSTMTNSHSMFDIQNQTQFITHQPTNQSQNICSSLSSSHTQPTIYQFINSSGPYQSSINSAALPHITIIHNNPQYYNHNRNNHIYNNDNNVAIVHQNLNVGDNSHHNHNDTITYNHNNTHFPQTNKSTQSNHTNINTHHNLTCNCTNPMCLRSHHHVHSFQPTSSIHLLPSPSPHQTYFSSPSSRTRTTHVPKHRSNPIPSPCSNSTGAFTRQNPSTSHSGSPQTLTNHRTPSNRSHVESSTELLTTLPSRSFSPFHESANTHTNPRNPVNFSSHTSPNSPILNHPRELKPSPLQQSRQREYTKYINPSHTLAPTYTHSSTNIFLQNVVDTPTSSNSSQQFDGNRNAVEPRDIRDNHLSEWCTATGSPYASPAALPPQRVISIPVTIPSQLQPSSTTEDMPSEITQPTIIKKTKIIVIQRKIIVSPANTSADIVNLTITSQPLPHYAPTSNNTLQTWIPLETLYKDHTTGITYIRREYCHPPIHPSMTTSLCPPLLTPHDPQSQVTALQPQQLRRRRTPFINTKNTRCLSLIPRSTPQLPSQLLLFQDHPELRTSYIKQTRGRYADGTTVRPSYLNPLHAVPPVPTPTGPPKRAFPRNTSISSSSSSPTLKKSLVKTELCANFTKNGECAYGARCFFAHGPEDLRPTPIHPTYKSQPCPNPVRSSGGRKLQCPYGSRCHFAHPSEPLRRVAIYQGCVNYSYFDEDYQRAVKVDYKQPAPYGLFL